MILLILGLYRHLRAGNILITGLEDLGMATTRRDTVTISGFSFEWILFRDLTGLFERRSNKLRRFYCIKGKRYGVYFFYDTSGSVHYVGLSGKKTDQDKYLYHRIGQHFQPGLSTGATFWKVWKVIHGHSNTQRSQFKRLIVTYQLGTLSIDLNGLNTAKKTKLIKVLADMEKFFICKFSTAYNSPCCNRLTVDARNSLENFVTNRRNANSLARRPDDTPPEPNGE